MSSQSNGAPRSRIGDATLAIGRYQLQLFNPAVLVELYLPKKAEYQGVLYQTLTDGFKPEAVFAHFENERTKERLPHFLKHYAQHLMGVQPDDPLKRIQHQIKELKEMAGQSSYIGYSMYEVDGVFFNKDKQEIEEERTQVIRLIFKPELGHRPIKRIPF